MYSPVQLAFKYFNYWWNASNGKGHGVHSPFVFEFITKVLHGEQDHDSYNQVESIRKQLLNNRSTIEVEDFGAGSRVIGTRQRVVRQIAKTSLKPKKYGQLLNRIVKHYHPKTILEIGTSLGITTSYLAKADANASIITMEGAKSIAEIAKQNFEQLNISNVQQVLGNFDQTLPTTLSQINSIDLAFIDGNHRYEPTISYFQQILARSNNNTIIILDDIYWSKEMEQAWQWVKDHDQVKLTIDLFAIGVVVLRPEILHKQHFSIRY